MTLYRISNNNGLLTCYDVADIKDHFIRMLSPSLQWDERENKIYVSTKESSFIIEKIEE